MKFNRKRCILHPGYGNLANIYKEGEKRLENRGRELWLWVYGKLNKNVTGCIRSSIACQLRLVIVSPCTALLWPHLKSCVQYRKIKLSMNSQEGSQDCERSEVPWHVQPGGGRRAISWRPGLPPGGPGGGDAVVTRDRT